MVIFKFENWENFSHKILKCKNSVNAEKIGNVKNSCWHVMSNHLILIHKNEISLIIKRENNNDISWNITIIDFHSWDSSLWKCLKLAHSFWHGWEILNEFHCEGRATKALWCIWKTKLISALISNEEIWHTKIFLLLFNIFSLLNITKLNIYQSHEGIFFFNLT
jgi:hypothetical protein